MVEKLHCERLDDGTHKYTIEVDADEYQYLKWFVQNADFGPADGDVRYFMHKKYEKRTGRKVPENWRDE